MAVTAKLYADFPLNSWGSGASGGSPIDLLSDTIKAALCTSSNGISQTADALYSDLTNESSGTGYSSGGITLTSKTLARSSLTTTFDADDLVYSTVSITAGQVHFFDNTTATPAKPLIMYGDFGGDQVLVSTTLTITLNASGLFSATVA